MQTEASLKNVIFLITFSATPFKVLNYSSNHIIGRFNDQVKKSFVVGFQTPPKAAENGHFSRLWNSISALELLVEHLQSVVC